MSRQIEFEGKTYEFPDDVTDAEVAKALGSTHPAAAAKPAAPTAPESAVPGWLTGLMNQLPGGGQETLDIARRAVGRMGEGGWGIPAGIAGLVNAGVNLAAPGLGAQMERGGTDLERGNYAKGALETGAAGLTAAINTLLPEIGTGVAETITPSVQGPIGRFFAANPRVAVARGLGPETMNPNLVRDLPQTLATLRERGGQSKFQVDPKTGQYTLIPAANRAIELNEADLGRWMNRAQGRTTSGQPMIQATQQSLAPFPPSEQAAATQALKDAQMDFGGDFDAQSLRAKLAFLNDEIASRYSQKTQQAATALTKVPTATLQAQRDSVAATLYNLLDPENAGANPRFIQRNTGNLIALRNAAQNQANLAKGGILAQEPMSGAERLPLPRIGLNMMSGKPHGFLSLGLSRDNPVSLINQAMKSTRDVMPYAMPQPEGLYPAGAAGRLLATGDIIPPAPADASTIRTGLAPHEQVNITPRALPPASSQIGVSGTTVPDILGRPGQATHHLLEPPVQPSVPRGQAPIPLSAAETSGITVSPAKPMVTIDPKTGLPRLHFSSEAAEPGEWPSGWPRPGTGFYPPAK